MIGAWPYAFQIDGLGAISDYSMNLSEPKLNLEILQLLRQVLLMLSWVSYSLYYKLSDYFPETLVTTKYVITFFH